jgi:hypothetical protein
MKRSIPLWVTIVATLLTLLTIVFSINLLVSPKTFFPDTDFLAKGVRHFTNMWGIRQLAFGALIAYSLIRQNANILKIALVLIIGVTILTIGEGIISNQTGLIEESLINCGISAIMILAINKRVRKLT